MQRIINPYDRDNSNSKALTPLSQSYRNENLVTDIVNHFITNTNNYEGTNSPVKGIEDTHPNTFRFAHSINNEDNNTQSQAFSPFNELDRENRLLEQTSESNTDSASDITSDLDDSYSDQDSNTNHQKKTLKGSSNSYGSKDTFAVESKAERKIKIGIINNILILLITSNMIFCIASFLILNSEKIFDINNDNNGQCQAQAFIQNFFDLSAICLTTVVSNILRCSQRQTYIILKKLTARYKWYIAYSVLFPLALSLG